MNIKINEKQFILNGKPEMILAGEIHYFRSEKSDWQHLIDELKASGFNTVATYIPWVIHEQIEGDFDITGIHKPQYDLVSFMQMVYENDLYFLPRPGPFTMAEMVNDGIPTWLPEKHPDMIPLCWDNNKAGTVDLDYLNENFLRYTKKWFDCVIPEIAKYEGKNLVGIQLDNEMGMLAWVSNSPVLNDTSIKGVQSYITENELSSHYPFDILDFELCKKKFRSPTEDYSARLHYDLADYFRIRIKTYTEKLEKMCIDNGIKDTLYYINVHGTGGGRLFGYPIGLSQLYKTFTGKKNYVSGSDIYFEDLKVNTLQDFYLSSAMTDAVNGKDQPLTSLEFNSVDGDFGFDYGRRNLARSNNHRARLLLGQGTKLFNFYLFSGGFNDYMNNPLGNGTDRIASTGEKHGYGSPIKPDGTRNYIFDQTAYFGKLVSNLSNKIGSMKQIHDDISIAFIPDYFKNEFVYPDSNSMKEIVSNVKLNTMDSSNEVIIRQMLLQNYMPTCINVQDNSIDTSKTKHLVLNSAKYMDSTTQNNIVEYLKNGGNLVLFGEVPEFDLCGNPCTILKSELGITIGKHHLSDWQTKKRVSVKPDGICLGLPQTFVDYAYALSSSHKSMPLLSVYGTEDTVGIMIENNYKAAIITSRYRCDLPFFDKIFKYLNVDKVLEVSTEYVGTTSSLLRNNLGESIISLINMDDFDRVIDYNIKNYGELKVHISALEAKLIPINIIEDAYTINYADCELYNLEYDKITFKLDGTLFNANITTDKEIIVDLDNTLIQKTDNGYTISRITRSYGEDFLTIIIK